MIVLDAIIWVPRTIAYSRIEESTGGKNYISRSKLETEFEEAFTLTPNCRCVCEKICGWEVER